MLRLKSILKYLLLTSISSTALMLSFTAQANDIVDRLLRDQDSIYSFIRSKPTAKNMLVFLNSIQPQFYQQPASTRNSLSSINSSTWNKHKQRSFTQLLLDINSSLSDSRFSDTEKLDLGIAMNQVITIYQIEIPFLTELLLHKNNYAFKFYFSQITRTYSLEKLFLHLLTSNDITVELLRAPAMIIANRLNLYSLMKILSVMNMRNPVGKEMDIKSKFVVQLLIQKSVQQKSTELHSAIMMKVFSTPEGFKHNQDLLVQMINVANPEQLGKVLIQIKIVKDLQTISSAIVAINSRIQEFDNQSVSVPESVRQSAKELSNIYTNFHTDLNTTSTESKSVLPSLIPNDGHNGVSMGCFMIYRKLKSAN